MKIAVVGLGHTGLVAAAVFAERGHTVIGHDIESDKLAVIREGRSPFYEPRLNDLLAEGLRSGRLAVHDELDRCLTDAEIIFLAVGTPAANGDGPNLSEFWAAAGQVVPLASIDAVLVLKSTVPVGTTDELIDRFRGKWPNDPPVAAVPEFLRQGSAVDDFLKPDRVVIGTYSTSALKSVKQVYTPFILPEEKFLPCAPVEAELIKHAANSFLAAKISFANELANLCGKLGADYDLVQTGVGSDPRIGRKFLNAGLGFGGSCFPKDLAALIKTGHEADARQTVLEAALAANRRQVEQVAMLADEICGGLRGKKIIQLGLTYKPDTDDVRGSPAMELAFLLAQRGADLICYDPEYRPTDVGSDRVFQLSDSPVTDCPGRDLLIVATEWPQFHDLPWEQIAEKMKNPILLDARNMLNLTRMAAAGFRYVGVGRRSAQ